MNAARANDWRCLVDEVRAKAAYGCEDLARTLLGNPNPTLSDRREMRWGSHGKLALQLGSDKRGLWFDFSTGKGGDIIDLVREIRGGTFDEAIGWLAGELNIDHERTRPVAPRSSSRPPPRSPDSTSMQAIRIWREALDPRGTFAEQYLVSRGLRLPKEAAMQTIRFHPECPWGAERAPALIAAFAPIVSAVPDDPFEDPPVTAIHRIRGRGHGNKKMLGPVAGQAILLSPWWHVHETLHVCEGLETAIALYAEGATDGADDADAWQFDGQAHRPIWALGSAGAFGSLPVIERVRRLVIWADHDKSGTGVRNAWQCAQRWADSGRDVVIRYPEETGLDYADLATARRSAAEALPHD